ncbi:hypothetical protein FN846DRAFT_970076 [Sphaerosporella brunnea]|uniref:RRM domain-containing protein n=1 Tax=Sphaerosporella brunnea TaxID=1250544 RepID=A0A5J5EJJ5_9PEZI|nr:hypothetical protein FN846DRAFT_970076 [Sphaerosporella brunnea]
MAATVHVSNIAPNTTEKDITNFFSFCGKIVNLSLTPTTSDPNSPLSATITFERDTAAKTAVLLDGTPLNNVPLRVEAAHSIEEIAGSHLGPSADLETSGDVAQETKPASAIMAEYLAAGYDLADSVLHRGIEFDKAHGITSKFASYLQNIIKTVESKAHIAEKAKQAESQYHFTEKAKGLARYFENVLGSTGAGQKVREFYQTSEKQAMDIHNEAKRLAELKKQQRRQSQELGQTADGKPFVAPDLTTCACGGQPNACTCEPGKCGCAGCAKSEADVKAGAFGQAQHAFEDVKGTAQDLGAEKV